MKSNIKYFNEAYSIRMMRVHKSNSQIDRCCCFLFSMRATGFYIEFIKMISIIVLFIYITSIYQYV